MNKTIINKNPVNKTFDMKKVETSNYNCYYPIIINAGSYLKCKAHKNNTLITIQNSSEFYNAHFSIEPDPKGKNLYNIPPGGLIAYTWNGKDMKVKNISYIDDADIQLTMIDLE